MKMFYTAEHEWIRVDGDTGTIGISAYAAEQLGDITFVDLPEVDDDVAKGETFCGVESVKAASDIYAPMSGTIIEINEALEDAPELINDSAEEEGWIVKINITDMDEDGLMDDEAYDAFLETLD